MIRITFQVNISSKIDLFHILLLLTTFMLNTLFVHSYSWSRLLKILFKEHALICINEKDLCVCLEILKFEFGQCHSNWS